jgi:hypothetical protein
VWRFHLGAGAGLDDPRRVCAGIRAHARAAMPRGSLVTLDGAEDAAYLVRHIVDGGLPRLRDEFLRACGVCFPARRRRRRLGRLPRVPRAGAGRVVLGGEGGVQRVPLRPRRGGQRVPRPIQDGQGGGGGEGQTAHGATASSRTRRGSPPKHTNSLANVDFSIQKTSLAIASVT